MWVAIEFKKASVQFNMMQSGDLSAIIPSIEQCICQWKQVSTDQRATALTDVESDEIRECSWKQSIVTSRAAFCSQWFTNQQWRMSLVLGMKRAWASNRVTKKCATNLRFVEDVTMMAISLNEVERMIVHLKISTEKHMN